MAVMGLITEYIVLFARTVTCAESFLFVLPCY